MPGPDPRMQTPDRRKKRMGPKTFVVGEDGKREVLRGGKPAKQTPPQPNKFLTGGQTKIAKKAPPFDKIDEKDFAVLRAEKAKGRGQGLQDEKVKPGKIMKAKRGKLGEAKDYKKYLKGLKNIRNKSLPGILAKPEYNPTVYDQKTFERAGGKGKAKFKSYKALGVANEDEFFKRRKAGVTDRALRAAKATRIGKIAAGVAGVGLAAKAFLNKKLEESRAKKKNKKMGGGLAAATERLRAQGKMGGGMIKKYSKGMDYQDVIRAAARDKAKVGEGKKFRAKTFEDKGRLIPDTPRNRKRYNRMGGGMMNKPMGYKSGKSVMAKGCKLGRKKPTKMYT